MKKTEKAASPAKMTTANPENLITKYSLYCADLQWFMSFCLTQSTAIFAALCMIGGEI